MREEEWKENQLEKKNAFLLEKEFSGILARVIKEFQAVFLYRYIKLNVHVR